MSRKDIDALFQQAVQLHHAGKIAAAQSVYREILAADPRHENTQYLYAASLHQTNQTDQAIPLLQKLLTQSPNHVDAHATLAEVFLSQNNLQEAITHFEQSLTLKPAQPKTFMNLGTAWQRAGNLTNALACFGQSLKLNPNSPEANYNLANLSRRLAQYDTAIDYYRRAIQHNPHFAEAHSNLGYSLKAAGQLEASIAAFEKAHALQPANAAIHSGIVYLLQLAPNKSAQDILHAHQDWYQKHAAHLANQIQPHPNDLTPSRRLKIGYVSPDFRTHCQSFFTIPLFENHNHADFEIHLYSDVLIDDVITERIKKTADHYVDTTTLSHVQLAEKIREDQIDILVDLTMHMAGSRLLAFAEKPAPIQITWLAYPGTTGLPTMDYRFSDRHLDPLGSESNYAEKTYRLPETFWCYDPLTDVKPQESPHLKNGYLTFGCLNNFCKVNDEVLELWSRVLRAVGDSKFILLCPEGGSRQNVLQVFNANGVASSRVEFTSALSREKYLELYGRMDVALDTFPYNGHTTTLDGLWMGVPVITLVGSTVVGRAGVSQLTNLGMPQFIAETKEKYVQMAWEMDQDRFRVSQIRRELRQKLLHSPLMDGPGFAMQVESAFREMWRQQCSEK